MITGLNICLTFFSSQSEHSMQAALKLAGDEGVVTKTVRHPFETEKTCYRLRPELKERCRELIERYVEGKETETEETPKPAEESGMKMAVILTLYPDEGKEETRIFRPGDGGAAKEAAEGFRKLFFDLTRDEDKISSEMLYPKLRECRELKESHGPVCGAEYAYYSSGMMYGSNQTTSKLVEKLDTGRVRVTIRKQAGNMPEEAESGELDSDIIERIQEISDRENIATWEYACIDPSIEVDRGNIPLDYSRSDSVSVYYDDTAITGAARVKRTIGNAACRMGGQEVFDQIRGLVNDAESQSGIQLAMPQFGPFRNPMAPQAAAPGQWLCSCGASNEGKYCSNCGMKKPQA